MDNILGKTRKSNITLYPLSLLEETETTNTICLQCQRKCNIASGHVGYCRTVRNENGKLYTLIYGFVSSAAVDPIEKKPLYHFYPGSRCFSVGSLGCNFRCKFCQNWQIAYADPESDETDKLSFMSPENLVEYALSSGCQGVAWTYNEPSIWYEYTLDCAKLCKKHGLYTVYVTNGYATAEHLDGIGPYLDAYRVDIKSMNDAFYKKMAAVPSVDGILEIALRAKHKWGMHVECVTNIVPGENDSVDELAKLARWIANELGRQTPWHVTRFFPHSQMIDTPPTPTATLQNAINIGRQEGLQFVYPGNVDMPGTSDTICPECGSVLVERRGYNTRIKGLDDHGCCIKDGQSVNLRLSTKSL